MFKFFKKKHDYSDKLYNKILLFSRNKFFYKEIGLADSYHVRLMLIFFHFSFLIVNLSDKKSSQDIKEISQFIFDKMFQKIDQDMREQTMGDVTVNKNMKILINNFYNILHESKGYLKLNDHKKNELFKKYMIDNPNIQKPNLSQLINYFNKYQSFCFDLSINSVLKGEINFKH
tara:strand:+ start:2166 stop:2687 length:522 start_codon:yes stop_codon:yes gene_type:complete